MAKTIKLATTKPVEPMIYAYTTPEIKRHDGWTKIGYTERDVDERIKQQTHTADVEYHEEWRERAVYKDTDETFRDSDFHAYLRKEGVEQEDRKNNEWFRISGDDSWQKFDDFRSNRGVSSTPEPRPYVLRKEQEEAVERAQEYFESTPKGEFLWNAKPRFGKTLAVYDLCLRMKAKSVLIVTNRPAVANSWYEDYVKFVGDASGYRFVSDTDALKNKPHVVSRETLDKTNLKTTGYFEFLSLQDLKGSVHFGGQYNKLKHIDDLKWDILVIDEAHEGVDTPKTDVAFDRIKRKHTLHLSGTPFKALACDKFPPDAIYSWTYADEQRAKRDWTSTDGVENPYADLPQLHMFTYQPSEMIQDVVKQGIEIDGEIEEYAFDLNEFFAVNEKGLFVHNDAVDRFLDSLTTQEKYPFSTEELRGELKHTFWLLKHVASARALAKKLKTHAVFKNYEIILAAGDGKLNDNSEMAADGNLYDDSENLKAYNKVKAAILQHDKTITLSVGQLTTGVTIKEWSAVLMLSNIATAGFYMQAAFRAQNPCLFHEGETFKRKQNAYVFDFDPARTLVIFEQIANDLNADTACGRGDANARKANLFELLNFLPIIGEDDQGEMIELDAERILSVTSKIKAKEVVQSGFRSNTLFQNIGAIFAAPCAVSNIIRRIPIFKDEKQSDESFEGITSRFKTTLMEIFVVL
ncbi:MAG: DEAD/DEAH box helicase family protein [Thermoguttaceae bacterium]|nr:DEAD/DEAH box helicase family protein [Thermoguttaceae bacterium]